MTRTFLPTAALATLLLAASAPAATLTITPDKTTYLVGETITLNVFGDSEEAQDLAIFGRILFNAELTDYVDSSQEQLTAFGGALLWTVGLLGGGVGFADAFSQIGGLSPIPADDPLMASVTLLANAPGVLDYVWETSGDARLDFFGLTNAPGGSVTIVPEPATGLLLVLGLLGLGCRRVAHLHAATGAGGPRWPSACHQSGPTPRSSATCS